MRFATQWNKASLGNSIAEKVEALFHQPPQAKKDLEAIIRARPHDHDAYEAHALLAGISFLHIVIAASGRI